MPQDSTSLGLRLNSFPFKKAGNGAIVPSCHRRRGRRHAQPVWASVSLSTPTDAKGSKAVNLKVA
jgi:hypothetical protein